MQDRTAWARVVRWFGGDVEVGPLLVAITDRGALLAWRRVIKWEWRR